MFSITAYSSQVEDAKSGVFLFQEDSPATEGATMTTHIELDKIPFSIYRECKVLTPDMVCANPGCQSGMLDFSVVRINGVFLSRFGNYCCRACREHRG